MIDNDVFVKDTAIEEAAKIRRSSLKEAIGNMDSCPFTGKRKFIEPVLVRLVDYPKERFRETSMLGQDRDAYYSKMKTNGFALGETYECIGIEGFGDVADLFIKNKDNEILEYCDFMFEDAPVVLEASK